MRLLATLLLAFLLGGCNDPARFKDSVVLLEIGEQGACTAWKWGGNLLATAAHCVNYPGPYTVRVDYHSFYEARISFVNAEHDLALLTVNFEGPVLPITQQLPSLGDEIVVIGFPGAGRQLLVKGVVSSAVEGDYILAQMPGTIPGISGAPVFCVVQQAVCGMVTASDGTAMAVIEPAGHWFKKEE